MEDYPRTLMEFERRFATEEACRAYLAQLRWPDGIRCPRCRQRKTWETTRSRYECAQCGFQASVLAGTIFQDTKADLRLWFRAMWYVTNQKSGVSALGLQRAWGLGSYRTAWSWLHKLRTAMVRPGRERLTAEVEVDEIYVGGVASERRGGRQQTPTTARVVVAAEVRGHGIGRIRLQRIPDASAKSLVGFVRDVVEPGSIVRTDGWTAYPGLARVGYTHRPRVISGSGQTASSLLPRVHRIAALLKRWLLGIHQGAVSPAQLDGYLDEFTFRFNRRTSRWRGKLFYRLVQQAVAVEPVRTRDLLLSEAAG